MADDRAYIGRSKELVQLCGRGRLYKLQKWIADGKSLEIPPTARGNGRKSLLEIAVDTGFHSLVELIAKHETNQSSKDAALAHAVPTPDCPPSGRNPIPAGDAGNAQFLLPFFSA